MCDQCEKVEGLMEGMKKKQKERSLVERGVMPACSHNQRCRYTHGFYCEDCNTFFKKDSPTYRSGELLSSIWMVLNNINVDLFRAGEAKDEEVKKMKDKIGIGIVHDNYEELIEDAEVIMGKYRTNSEAANLELKA